MATEEEEKESQAHEGRMELSGSLATELKVPLPVPIPSCPTPTTRIKEEMKGVYHIGTYPNAFSVPSLSTYCKLRLCFFTTAKFSTHLIFQPNQVPNVTMVVKTMPMLAPVT